MRADDYTLKDFQISEIARLCHVSLKTAKRWRDGTTCPPSYAVLILIGDLGALNPQWYGWRLRDNTLITPDGIELRQGDVQALPFMRQQIQIYQLEFRQMQMVHYKDQPTPDEWDDEIMKAAASAAR